MKCIKCHGTGRIEGFAHIAQGVCFACGGRGELPDAKKNTVTFAQSFIAQFAGEDFFPKELKAEKLYAYAFIGHPTAESQVLKDDAFYYVGQPICRSSTWWQVPIAEWDNFKKFFQKARKTVLQ